MLLLLLRLSRPLAVFLVLLFLLVLVVFLLRPVQMEAGIDRMDNIGSVGRSAKVVRRLTKKGQFLVIINLQVKIVLGGEPKYLVV